MTAAPDLEGRRILITGAASGIGAATARLFARHGAGLALLDIDADRLATVASETMGQPLAADLCDATATAQAVESAARALGGLDGIVHCAGIATVLPLTGTTPELWRRVMGVNLDGTFHLCHAAIPHLQRSPGATIVTVASASGLLPSGAGAAYGASKAGVAMLMKYLARELGPAIRVNSVCPGVVDTPMVRATRGPVLPQAMEDQLRATYALGRMARPDEIAEALLFLTSARSSFVTGVALAVDGGRSYH